ncbi:MAG: hypothetical protein FWH02_08120 [Oscillospiraceae bacterium]|nr:hypothetical protein [Oscillospiraceae bacterium]
MAAYELMIETNRRLIAGELLTDAEKKEIVSRFLNAANFPKQAICYGVEPISKARRPLFFLPPQNGGKKLKTVMGQMPKTHILNGNMYELEILRLLLLFAPDDPMVIEMTAQTLNRLKSTCFGYYGCSVGECFDAALVVLRFLIVAAPDETVWIKKIIDMYYNYKTEKKRVKAVDSYFRLCLSELTGELADRGAS